MKAFIIWKPKDEPSWLISCDVLYKTSISSTVLLFPLVKISSFIIFIYFNLNKKYFKKIDIINYLFIKSSVIFSSLITENGLKRNDITQQ